MPTHSLPLDIVWLTYDDESCLAVPVLLPELVRFSDSRVELRNRLIRSACRLFEELDPEELSRRQPCAVPETHQLTIEFTPPRPARERTPHSAWQQAVTIDFHYVSWQHGNAARIAYVPVLDLEVISQQNEDLAERVREEIHSALRRGQMPLALPALSPLHRVVSAEVERVQITADLRSLKHRFLEAHQQSERSELAKVATDLAALDYPPVFGYDNLVARLAELLGGTSPRGVLLVGPSGVGKTALFHALHARRRQFGLGSKRFWTTSGARIVAGMSGFGMWEERCLAICRETAKTKAIVHLGNMIELVHVGKSEASDHGVADYLSTYVQRGDLLAVAECTPEQLALLERLSPRLSRNLFHLHIPEPSGEAARAILRQSGEYFSARRPVVLTDNAVATVDRLHRRYATYSAFPGRPLRFLRNRIETTPPGQTVTGPDITRAFSDETGLPIVLLEDTEPLDLEAARVWMSQRVIGQDRAIDVIVDLLASVKAGMTRPERPIASLLLIGPTGVGKTEMAKTLANFLYQDQERMVRIDMSEYADAAAASRLVDGVGGAEGILTAKVRQQPFGVVLLDEFEKADGTVFDLLLQVLGEGRLTDGSGRLADFRNSVIIMTSNLGSETFGREEVGFDRPVQAGERAEQHFSRAVQEAVRPELFNRIDAIVPFLPLSEETLFHIAAREVEQLRKREGMAARDVDFQVTREALERIVQLGYDPRYGARPLKRVIDRHLAAPIAAALNQRKTNHPLAVQVGTHDQMFHIQVRVRDDDPQGEPSRGETSFALASRVPELRRAVHQLDAGIAIWEIRNAVRRWALAADRQQRRSRGRGTTGKIHAPAQVREARKLMERMNLLMTDVVDLEDRVLCGLYAGQQDATPEWRNACSSIQEQLDALYLDLFAHVHPESNRLTLIVYGRSVPGSADLILQLAQAYGTMALDAGLGVNAFVIQKRSTGAQIRSDRILLGDRESSNPKLIEQANDTSIEALAIEQWQAFLARQGRDPGWLDHAVASNPAATLQERLQTGTHGARKLQPGSPTPSQKAFGIALELQGPLAHPRFIAEEGRHVFEMPQHTHELLVHASSQPLHDYQPPRGIDSRGSLDEYPVRRLYHRPQRFVEDKLLHRKEFWKGKQLLDVVRIFALDRFLTIIRQRIDEG